MHALYISMLGCSYARGRNETQARAFEDREDGEGLESLRAQPFANPVRAKVCKTHRSVSGGWLGWWSSGNVKSRDGSAGRNRFFLPSEMRERERGREMNLFTSLDLSIS